jgi:broad specificity phosphatase PhoE
VRDSPLTNHGFQQAKRLGQFLNASGTDVTHVFASPLQRAAMTAEQVLLSQPESIRKEVSVIPASSLREQDFGLYEGVAYGEFRSSDTRHNSVETTQLMARRADLFVEQYLEPLLESKTPPTVVIVSHGKMLQVLWTQILAWLKPTTVKCDRQLLVDTSSLDYTRIAAWSNTGFLESTFKRTTEAISKSAQIGTQSADGSNTSEVNKDLACITDEDFGAAARVSCEATISAINGRPHLSGFIRTKGGVGSSRYDAQQGTLDRFLVGRSPNS